MADFPAIIDLGALDGTDGFRLNGIDPGDYSGFSVASAGDVNGDGFDDVVIGAFLANGATGQTYVVFGQSGGFSAEIDLSALDGTNGFRLDGINDGDFSGFSVASAGDVNGDGFADIIIGAWSADPDGNDYAGETYIVFGSDQPFDASLDLAALDGSDGFRLDGIAPYDYSGRSVASAGDVNGDGFDDVIIGAYGAAGGDPYAGETYVVFGHGGPFDPTFDLATLDGTNGFQLNGVANGDNSGFSVASAGDVNGDGFADVIVGAYLGYGSDAYAGESYVVFGRTSGFAAEIDLGSLNGRNGFRLDGADPGDYSGFSVASAGDVNGDGFDDLIVGAWLAGGYAYAGQSYVVFGHRGKFAANIDLGALDGTDGFRLDGAGLDDYSGFSVASAGDVNGDGFDDLIIGGPGCGCGAGSGFVVFGHAGGFAPAFDLGLLDGDNGFIVEGIAAGDRTANSVASAGDVNGDGFDDVVIGAPAAYGGGAPYSGETYVVFGREPTAAVTRIGATADQTIRGGAFDDTLSGRGGDDILDGRGGDDRLIGGYGDDTLLGGDGNDRLVGWNGIDTMTGGAGNDIYQIVQVGDLAIEEVGEGTDLVFARIDYTLADNIENLRLIGGAQVGTGNGLDNHIYGSGGDDTLSGLDGADVLQGLDGADSLDGGAGADWLVGGLGADTLLGGDGNDRLVGGAGVDTLTGGAGRDAFMFADGDSGATWGEADTVTDFDHGAKDKLRLDQIDADTGTGGDQAFNWIGAAAFTGVAGQLHYVHDSGTTYVEGDTNGDGVADFAIALTGLHTLVASDFVL